MKITVASGKGGTGKTTIAVNLALSVEDAMLIDCDVEGPNSHIFFKEPMVKLKDVSIPTPRFDLDICTYCGKCSDFCQYNAISVVQDKLLFFEELCHGCGGCRIICPVNAISEEEHIIGTIEKGGEEELPLYHGRLNIGEPFGVPIIRELKGLAGERPITIFDSPPGTACPAVETMRDVDFCILVTEPTPFGLHDLKLSVDVIREIGTPFGVIVNRDGIGDDRVESYCERENIPLLARIPNDLEIARLYSEGIPMVKGIPRYEEMFRELFERIRGLVR
ncbi:(4Fe-4S)-binding protein [Thermoplasmatales archaeon ex4484_6]|nr:MAG: (4Fe-4S)-binding protein [Thermoplasmatales archaeon ex4484_6]RLF65520.1 MAG: (4Fe-4S)-binding protein [Thermoplasmata archaeon]